MNQSYWAEAGGKLDFPPLESDLAVDCLVIGGGITGVTAAFLLRKEGKSVALVERDWIGAGDTGHTTAHLTYMTDARLNELVATHGKEGARLAWKAGLDAMNFIRATVGELGIDCEFIEAPGYLAAAYDGDWDRERKELAEEAALAKELGFDVSYVEDAPPGLRPGIRFAGQYQFHPLKYLYALARRAADLGVRIYEKSDVTAFSSEPRSVTANGHRIEFASVVIATHVPLQGNTGMLSATLFQSKLASYSTYAISAKIPSGSLPEMIWSDTDEPFLYLRTRAGEGGDFAILGGEDHKTGQEDHTRSCYSHLEDALDAMVPGFEIDHRWTGQVVNTVDGLPYIGMDGEGQFLATGFSGNGFTFGTVAAMMVRDALTEVQNPYADLFALDRKKLGAIPDYIRENTDFPVHMVTDRMGTPKQDPEELAKGCGKILHHQGKRIAAYRDAEGSLHQLSPVCPHLGCIVAWNETEKTWDCPCHGSRFCATGELVAGPAAQGLSHLEEERISEPARS